MSADTPAASPPATSTGSPVADTAPGSPAGLTHAQIRTILIGLMAGMLLAALDQTIVATSIRTIADDLDGLSLQAWVTTAYLITSTVTTPIYGKLSDIYGRRPLFITAISIFIVGSIACTLATSMYELSAYRALQGIGAGGLFSMALAILADIVPPRQRARYQGYFLAVFGMSSVVGPLVGGFFAGQETILGISGWRWVFLVNVPIGIVALAVVAKVLHIPHIRHDHRIDWWGAAALMIGIIPLLIVAEQGREWGWASVQVLGLIVLGVVGVAAFIFVEFRMKDEALIPMRLFSSRVFSIGLGVNVLVGLGMFGALSTLPLYLQLVKGASPTESGLLLIPMMIGIMGGSVLSGQLTSRTGRYKIFPVIGTFLLSVTFFGLLWISVDTGYVMLDIYFLAIGLGLGLCMQTMLIAVQNTVPAKDMGVATSSATFFRQLGGTLGVAVFLSLLFNSLPDRIQSAFQSAAQSPSFQQAVQAAAADPNSPSHEIATNLVQAAQGNPAAGASLNDALNTNSSFLSTISPDLARPFQEGFVSSTQLVYIVGGIVMACAFLLVLTMKELPLRTQSALQERMTEQAEEDAAIAAVALEDVSGADFETDLGDDASHGRHDASPGRHSTSAGSMPVGAILGSDVAAEPSQDGRGDGRGRRNGHAVPGRHAAEAPADEREDDPARA